MLSDECLAIVEPKIRRVNFSAAGWCLRFFTENVPDLHLAFTFDVETALRFAGEVVLDELVRGFRDLN